MTKSFIFTSVFPKFSMKQFQDLWLDGDYQAAVAKGGKLQREDQQQSRADDRVQSEWNCTMVCHLKGTLLAPLRRRFGSISATWHENHSYFNDGRGSLDVHLRTPFVAKLHADAKFAQEGPDLVRKLTFNIADVELPGWLAWIPGAHRIVITKICDGLRNAEKTTRKYLEDRGFEPLPESVVASGAGVAVGLNRAVSPAPNDEQAGDT